MLWSPYLILLIIHLCYAQEKDLDVTSNLIHHGDRAWNKNVTITYSLWVGDNVTETIRSIKLSVPQNTSFYNVMKIAAQKDNKTYGFENAYFPKLGHYITAIGGLWENRITNNYWMIYNLTRMPDPLNPPADYQLSPVGVDNITATEGSHYLFWYKHVEVNKNVSLTYSLWVGTNVTETIRTMKISAPRNASFYKVMQIAAQKDRNYEFSSKVFPGGSHLITEIGGVRENNITNNYWMIYNLTRMPDPLNPPADYELTPAGVDNLKVTENSHYLFWYKYVNHH